MYLTRLGYEVLAIRRRECRIIREDLTLTTQVSAASPVPGMRFKAYAEYPDRLVVPAQWGLEKFGMPPVDMRSDGVRRTPMSFCGSLREAQRAPTDAALSLLRSKGACTMVLPTGFGKTCCGLYAASQLGLKTLVIVNKKNLADQWKARIHQFLPGTSVTAVAGTGTDFSGDVVIATIQTLVSRRYAPETFREFGFLVFDEANHAAARVFNTVLYGLSVPYMLALTATPERKDGLERLIYDFFGPPVALDRSQASQNPATVCIVRYSRMLYASPPPKNRFGGVDFSRMMGVLADDAERTQRIADLVADLPESRQVLVLSHRRQHCQDIVRCLLDKGCDAVAYLGGGAHTSVPESRILVATFSLAGEGFDCPRLDTLVLATPASDVVQAVGRVLRGAPDPRVYDIHDAWSVLNAQASKRRAQYKTLQCIVKTLAQTPCSSLIDRC